MVFSLDILSIISYTSYTSGTCITKIGGERMKAKKEGKYMGSVKVGPKGQIVIPKEVRDMFEISPGDTLLLLADSKKGIALERYGVFAKIADAIFDGKAKDIYPESSEDDSMEFAKAIKKVYEEEEENNDSNSD